MIYLKEKLFKVWVVNLLLFSTTSQAAFMNPWINSHSIEINMGEILHNQINTNERLYEPKLLESSFNFALQDKENRVNKLFHIPHELKHSVSFWLKLYTQYSEQQIIFFDEKDLNIVYEVMDLSKFNFDKNQIYHKIEKYKHAFYLLEKKHVTSSIEAQNILKAIHNSHKKRSFSDLKNNFKSIPGQRNDFVHGILQSEKFLKKMEIIFKNTDIPIELTRLPLVESSFNTNAISKAGAVGVWQFIPQMGKQYLMINDHYKIDERRSPLKATLAAAQVLKWNFNYFKNWILTIISYNHGLRHLTKFRQSSTTEGLNNSKQLMQLFNAHTSVRSLGWASRNYYLEFLAAVYAEAYQDLFFPFIKNSLKTTDQDSIHFYKTKDSQFLTEVAAQQAIPLQELIQLNPDILDIHQKLPKNFRVLLPTPEKTS